MQEFFFFCMVLLLSALLLFCSAFHRAKEGSLFPEIIAVVFPPEAGRMQGSRSGIFSFLSLPLAFRPLFGDKAESLAFGVDAFQNQLRAVNLIGNVARFIADTPDVRSDFVCDTDLSVFVITKFDLKV